MILLNINWKTFIFMFLGLWGYWRYLENTIFKFLIKGLHNLSIWPPKQLYALNSKSNLEVHIFYCRNGFGISKYIIYDEKMKIWRLIPELLEIFWYLACDFSQIFLFCRQIIKIAQNWAWKHYIFITEMGSAQNNT